MFVQVGKNGLEKEKDRIRNTGACRNKKLKQLLGEETNRTKQVKVQAKKRERYQNI